jgi:antitoxin MazE
MSIRMDLPVIKIGNSKGIRLSKTILQKYEIKDTVELVLEEDFIVLKPKHIARKGWGR